MRVLVVYCHPVPESFTAAVRDAALQTLAANGHETRLADLYAEGFDPVMGEAERRGYEVEGPNLLPVAGHVENLRWAEAVVFVYPTWWFGLPAMLKGWMDRVLVPGFAFIMPTAIDRSQPAGLAHIRRVVILTSGGASWWVTRLMGQPGRRTLARAFRALCAPMCRVSFAAIYKMDTASGAKRARHLARVRRIVGRL